MGFFCVCVCGFIWLVIVVSGGLFGFGFGFPSPKLWCGFRHWFAFSLWTAPPVTAKQCWGSRNQCHNLSASLLAISFRQKVCCGIIYKGRFGEVLIDTHLFKPCCSNKKSATEKPEQEGPQSPAISTQEEWWLPWRAADSYTDPLILWKNTRKVTLFTLDTCLCCQKTIP